MQAQQGSEPRRARGEHVERLLLAQQLRELHQLLIGRARGEAVGAAQRGQRGVAVDGAPVDQRLVGLGLFDRGRVELRTGLEPELVARHDGVLRQPEPPTMRGSLLVLPRR